tara:strand:+ start:287 stop:571 length:285 start_codon:yes stop_codon:yes gene_type:complete
MLWCRTSPVIRQSFFGLAPKGVYNTFFVTKKVVSSYLTFSPLPKNGGFFSVALSLGFPPPDVIRLWCSAESGLSSFKRQPYDHLAYQLNYLFFR